MQVQDDVIRLRLRRRNPFSLPEVGYDGRLLTSAAHASVAACSSGARIDSASSGCCLGVPRVINSTMLA